jgi:PAS domain S-box-containing protein
MKILLLEDNSTDADLAKRGLTGSIPGCTIEHASTLEQARKFINANLLFDIALLDVNLPDGNGLEFLMEIRQQELKFPVIMLTGSGDEEAAVTALKTGADDYVVKRSGYIIHLPDIINLAITNFKENDLYKSEIIHILYIEQYAADIDFTVRHLAQYAPYIHIDSVPTAEEALSRLENKTADTHEYKVVLMDYRLPGMNALELIKTIRQKIKLCIPIILVTGQGSEELAVQALKLGANDYLTKSEKYLYRLPSVIVNSYQHYELRRKQDALVESESRYRLLADNSGDVIFVLDMDLNYTYISPAIKALRGFEPEEAIKQKIKEVLTPASYQKAVKVISDILSEKLNSPEKPALQETIELEMIRKDKTTIWTEVKASLITDKKNNIVGILGVTRDISERKSIIDELIIAKEKAEESDQLKTAFLHNVSHEIRTPLNAIVGFSAILTDPMLANDKRQHFCDIVVNSSNQLLSIITDIINISTIEAGQEKLNLKNINVNSKCNLIYEQFVQRTKNKNISFRYYTPLADSEAIIMLDETKFMQVLTNLLDNAFKFITEGYVIYGYNLKNDFLEFYVEDTGIGIHPDMHQEIFKRFRQVEVSVTRQYGGSGLGLSISKAYVELQGGKIWLKSELGKGSVFYFTVPYKKEVQDGISDNQIVNEITIKNNKPLTVLIAEDEDFNFMLLEEMLSGSNFNIIRALNGIEAVEMCKTNKYLDLVLMDIKMPLMDGYEATKRIRLFNSVLPIIAQTAYSTEADKIKALTAGCNDFLSKPFKQEQLISKITEQLNIK